MEAAIALLVTMISFFIADDVFPVKSAAAKVWRSAAPDVILQKRLHETLFVISLRDHALWIFDGDRADGEVVPIPDHGHVWDLGCNIGLYSVQAAKHGCRVSAFDISMTNVLRLNQTAHLNDLDIKAHCTPITVNPVQWTPAQTAHTEESLNVGGSLRSLTYLEASSKYGIPSFIKMDIQGGEVEFLKSGEFRDWIIGNHISFYLETHNDAEKYIWPEFKRIGDIHWFIEGH